jgi:hypothetical protein
MRGLFLPGDDRRSQPTARGGGDKTDAAAGRWLHPCRSGARASCWAPPRTAAAHEGSRYEAYADRGMLGVGWGEAERRGAHEGCR